MKFYGDFTQNPTIFWESNVDSMQITSPRYCLYGFKSTDFICAIAIEYFSTNPSTNYYNRMVKSIRE